MKKKAINALETAVVRRLAHINIVHIEMYDHYLNHSG